MTAADVSPEAAIRELLEALPDDTIRAAVESFVAGLLHGMADELTDRVVAQVLARIPAAPDTAPTPAVVEPIQPEPSPELERPTARTPRGPDAVRYTCELCGRDGSRRFERTETGWRCTDVTACDRRRDWDPASEPQPAAAAAPQQAPPPSDIPAKPIRPNVTPDVTARCQDCTRTWTLTGRVLQSAIEMHELKHSHIVQVL